MEPRPFIADVVLTTVLTAGLTGGLTGGLAGCGQQAAQPAAATASAGTSTAASTTASTTASTASSSSATPPRPVGQLRRTAYPADLAAAVHTRGFDVRPAGGRRVRVSVAAAVAASHDFRPPGVPTAVHLALVTTPGFGSLDFSAPDHAAKHLFNRTAAWLVVYDGQEAGQPGTWVVFVNARTGVAQAMVGFGAGLQGGAPCPNNRCIFE